MGPQTRRDQGLLRCTPGAQDGPVSPPLRCSGSGLVLLLSSSPEQQLSCHRPAAPPVPAVAASSFPHAAVACRDPSPGFAEASRPFPSLSSVTSASPGPFFSLCSLSRSQPFSKLLRGMLPHHCGGCWPLGEGLGLPRCLSGEASACHAGDSGSMPGLEDPPEKEMATHSSNFA